MRTEEKRWAVAYAKLSIRRPVWILLGGVVVTLVALVFASRLEMRMNWTDLLPETNPIVRSYREVQTRFGDPSVVIALEGDRNAMVAMAGELVPKLEALSSMYNVQAKLPEEFFRHHALVNVKPDLFKRSLRMFSDPSLVGTFRGMNDDYEREYTESESNLKRDEVEIARSLLGLTRSLEILRNRFAGAEEDTSIAEAADAMALGEPWMLSLDRRMLLISCTPKANMYSDIEGLLAAVSEIEEVTAGVAPLHPAVKVGFTGIGKIGQDEMNTVNLFSWLMTLAALILIFLLLARSFNGWLIPIIALTPLVIGIIWTMGLLDLMFGGLNIFTSLMMVVLLGLGIDFSIHLISRFREETALGGDLPTSLARMLGATGTAVITGALTTALAFLTLMTAETRGIFQFGAAAGTGILMTLIAVFLFLPPLLVLARRKREKLLAKAAGAPAEVKPGEGHTAFNLLGRIARWSWVHPGIVLSVTTVLAAAAYWGMQHTGYEYDWLKLEAKGLVSVHLQREIPKRFGMADHSAWVITDSIEESRSLKEKLRRQSLVGEVVSISDYIPPAERLAEYTPQLEAFRRGLERRNTPAWQPGDEKRLAAEMNRLWDNLDLMSNLAFTAGLDRIVKVIDQLTGYDTETNTTDTTAILPSLTRELRAGVDPRLAQQAAAEWNGRMRATLHEMADPEPVEIDDLPPVVRKSFLPRTGTGYLLMVFPRKNLWDRAALMRFAEQTEAVDPAISGSERLFLLMMDSTLEEGRRAALLALALIALLMLLHFRGPTGWLALFPLALGSLFMLGLMYLLGMKHNYMTLITVPIILGIGIDDGVHVIHRFRKTVGDGSTRIYDSYRFVGRAILLSSLTTMIGFGSVAFHEMRGMASFGQVLFLGVGFCFLTTVLILPAILRLFLGGKVARESASAAAAGQTPALETVQPGGERDENET